MKERFIGTIIGMLLGFIGRIILVRFTTQPEYGIFSLALVLISIFVTISTLGLNEGSTRYIAYHREAEKERKKHRFLSIEIKSILVIANENKGNL